MQLHQRQPSLEHKIGSKGNFLSPWNNAKETQGTKQENNFHRQITCDTEKQKKLTNGLFTSQWIFKLIQGPSFIHS